MRLYAFWKYDTFPYCLSGEVEKILPNGNVIAKNFTGMAFKPTCIVPLEQGLKMKEKLKEIKEEYDDKSRVLLDTSKKKVKELFKDLVEV